MIRFIAAYMTIYLPFALISAIFDGTFVHAQDITNIQQTTQIQTVSAPLSETSINPITWFQAGINFFAGLVDMLSLNFSYLQDGIPLLIRIIMLSVLVVPIMIEIAARRFGSR